MKITLTIKDAQAEAIVRAVTENYSLAETKLVDNKVTAKTNADLITEGLQHLVTNLVLAKNRDQAAANVDLSSGDLFD